MRIFGFMFISLWRTIKFAWKNFFRNFWLSLSTISIIVLTLLSVNFLFFLNALTLEAAEAIKDKIDITIYFKPEVTSAEGRVIEEKLEKITYIKSLKYIPREDALESFQQKHEDDFIITESLKELSGNPLGDSIIIKAEKIEDYPLVLEALERSKYAEFIQDKDFDDNQEFLDKLKGITDKIKKIGLAIIVVFILIAILVMFNTIRITIYTHSHEINIMKLVGASNWFIRLPFLIEAVFYALVSVIVTLAILYPILALIEPYISGFFNGNFSVLAYFSSHLFELFIWEFIGCSILNIFGSSIATSKYLQV